MLGESEDEEQEDELQLCSSLYVFGFRHVWGLRCPCLLVVPRVVRWLQNLHFPRLGATISIIAILWQISFLGIRVGEASNPGPAMPNFVPVSDGVTRERSMRKGI